MLLVVGLRDHRGPLRASLLAVYGIRLGHHDFGLIELAELVESLPAGCAFWQSFGGSRAWTTEVHFLSRIEFHARERIWQAGGNKGPRPEPETVPPVAIDRKNEEAQISRAERMFQKRFGK